MMRNHRIRTALAIMSTLALTAVAAPSWAQAADPTVAETTVAGVHNTYNPADYPYLAQALDAGAHLIELDVWDDIFNHEWKVSHDKPISNSNNCVIAVRPADLYTGGANKDLESCLDDVRVWLAAHPAAGPVSVKLELKDGLSSAFGLGPSQLSATVAAHLGSALYRPADLLGGVYATPDQAAKANAWPSRDALAGKALVYAIPGTVEQDNPLIRTKSDVQLATYDRTLAAAGTIAQASIFPAVLGAASGDPRTRYADATIRPWFVFFDGDASTYVTSIDTHWYVTNHYLLTMTDAQNVAPALDDTHPSVPAAQARVAQLAAAGASAVSSDWYALPAVLSEVLPRG